VSNCIEFVFFIFPQAVYNNDIVSANFQLWTHTRSDIGVASNRQEEAIASSS